jgi:hypothetical protein
MKSPGCREEPIEPGPPRSRIRGHHAVDRLTHDFGDGNIPSPRLGAQPAHLVRGQGDLRPDHREMLSPGGDDIDRPGGPLHQVEPHGIAVCVS